MLVTCLSVSCQSRKLFGESKRSRARESWILVHFSKKNLISTKSQHTNLSKACKVESLIMSGPKLSGHNLIAYNSLSTAKMCILHSALSICFYSSIQYQMLKSITNAKAHFPNKRLHKDLSFLCNQAKNKNLSFFNFWNKTDAIQIIQVSSST